MAADAAADEDEEGAADEPGETVTAPVRAATTPEGRLAELRVKIDRLGPVNMMAIDQFDELSARHTFLTAQRRDLVDSIQTTGETIRRIDQTSKQRFREAFAVINENFQETFGTLFGGGHAGLTLLDRTTSWKAASGDQQPPGKRLQASTALRWRR